MKAVGYIRVSTEEQAKEGVSLDNQIERIKSYCNYKGYGLLEVIKDEGISGGKNRDRKGFVRLLERLEENDFDAVVLYSLERISRDMLTLLCLEKLFDEYNVELHTVEGEIDTSTPDGFMGFAMRAFLGEMERRQVKYRTKRAMEYKKRKGEVVGSIPYGFKRDGDSLIPNENEQELIRVVNRLYQGKKRNSSFSGIPEKKSLSFIVKRLTELGYQTRQGKSFRPQQVKRIIKDYEPVYSSDGQKQAEKIKEFIFSIA